ncbi:hypothetical protein FRC09_016897 [Ceratobasidium sp. 395]|nr:hypothetical protein FRC09_016897 [Ceratobasidium sp. 395]
MALSTTPLWSPIQLKKVSRPKVITATQTPGYGGWRATSQIITSSSPPSSPISAANSATPRDSLDLDDSDTDVDVVGLSDSDPDVDVVGLSDSDLEDQQNVEREVQQSTKAKATREDVQWSDEEVDVLGLSDEDSKTERPFNSTLSPSGSSDGFRSSPSLEGFSTMHLVPGQEWGGWESSDQGDNVTSTTQISSDALSTEATRWAKHFYPVFHLSTLDLQLLTTACRDNDIIDISNDEEVDIMGWSDEESHIEQQAASTTSQKEDLNSFGGTFNLEDSPLLSEGLSDISDISTYYTDHYKASNPANAPQTNASSETDVIDISSSDESEAVDAGILDAGGNNTGQLRALQLCLEAWGISCDWDTACDANPIWDTLHSPLMAEHTMDHVSAYLVYSSARALRQDSQGHCLVPASLSGALLQLENIAYGVEDWIARTGPTAMTQLLLQRQMVWSGLEPPKLVLIPIIDHLNAHCYLWFGAVRRCSNSGLYNLDLSLLDSLGSPSRETVRARLAACISVLQFLLPQVNGAISGKHLAIPGYQQAAGSTDCGYFVCQAISAITYGQRQSLKSLFPVKLVKESVLEILESCKGGVLKDLVTGYAPTPPIILHLPPSYAPPPWLQKPTEQRKQNTVIQVQTWTPPMLKRSLSEPLGDCKSGVGLGSWEEVFGPTVHVLFEQVSGAAFQGYLEAVSNGTYIAPQGLLANSGGPVPQSLMQGLLPAGESELIPWAPDVLSSEGSDEEGPLDPEGGTGLRRFLQGLSYLQEGRERSLAMLTGEHRNQPLHLNWTKETVDISEEWFTAGLDVDSLSLTATQPQFTSGVVFYAYPPRSGTLTTDNGLSVKFEGTSKKLSHIPNLAFAHAGSHNQFRVNIFFPHYQKGQNSAKQYITMMNEQDFTQWYDDVVWQAICRMKILCPEPYRHAATCLRQLLPRSYQNAKLHATQGGLESKGYKILPELFNLLLHYARKIVERNPRLFKFKDFFLHVWGTNLKAIGHEVWRKDGNALLHVLKSFPIVDWSLQNPRDIAVDVGLELNIQQDTLPSDIDGLTLLWRLGALKSLARHGWRKAHVDAYVHSHTVGGISASPRSTVASQLYYVHAYMKDKVLTYRHRDSSIGTGFSPEDSLLNSQRYVREVASLSQVLKSSPGSFGVRVEWRCGVWAANQILSLDPTLWIQRFQHTSAIVSHVKLLV